MRTKVENTDREKKAGMALVPIATGGQLDSLRPAMEQATRLMSQAKAGNTVRAYQSDWKAFESWCRQHGLVSLPADPQTVSIYLAGLSDSCKSSTIERKVAAISQAHQVAGRESPTHSAPVRALLAGVRRTKGTAAEGKAPVLTADVRMMVATLPDNLLGIRNRALLLIGFSGAFRRSELVGLDATDLAFSTEGLTVTLRRSKTDQEGQGRVVGIPYGSTPTTCPIRSVQRWLEASGITEGPVFRAINRHGQLRATRLTDQVVATVVKSTAAAAGLDATQFAGHSLRAGLATQSAMNGASERSIMDQTGHRSTAMVRKYIRIADLFKENAASRLGL